MERILNLISPRARRKKFDLGSGEQGDGLLITATPKTFGVSLEELMFRAPEKCIVPSAVSRICEYLYRFGLDSVGLFRVSGSVRVVERMRMQFELMGDINLEVENDVAATAGLLKVFLRDLPDTLVPARLTHHFFSPVQNPNLKKDAVLAELKKALSLLPEENYNVLKYISSLLVMVVQHEGENKMSGFSLAIIFGPNVFSYRLGSGMEGIKEMDSSKDVMQILISEYVALFAEEGESSVQEFWEKTTKKSPPPRPPPPKVSSSISTRTTNAETIASPATVSDHRPIPSPRKMKNVCESHDYCESEDQKPPVIMVNSSIPLFSPREVIDINRAQSPFTLESETHSLIDSPMVTARTNEFVEKTIVETISEHIFGALDFNQNSRQQDLGLKSPKTAPDVDLDLHDGKLSEVPLAKQCSSSGSRQLPSLLDVKERAVDGDSGNEFDHVGRNQILFLHKRPAGPVRRLPSRKHRHYWKKFPVMDSLPAELKKSPVTFQVQNKAELMSDPQKDNHEDEKIEKTYKLLENPLSFSNSHKAEDEEIFNSSKTREKQIFRTYADVVNGVVNPRKLEAGVTPMKAIKLYIPPLDLSTLNECVNGKDAVQLSNVTSPSSNPMNDDVLPQSNHIAIVSPETHKLGKHLGTAWMDMTFDPLVIEAPMSPSAGNNPSQIRVSHNTDIPPSPPISQDLYKKHSDDDCSHRLRQLTKKIQGLKRKIKVFEENFEKVHGYKPSQGERAAQPEVKKFMQELCKARKDLKRLKEETERSNRSRHNSGASSGSSPVAPSVLSTLDFIVKCLKEKRQEAGRPEDVSLMTQDQIHDEKLAVQRSLLHFEGLHGRPSTKEDKDLMRPLYDRYRYIKRILAKPVSPRNSVELQTVPEEQVMEISGAFQRTPIHVPTACIDEIESGQSTNKATKDFSLTSTEFGLVTHDMGILQGSQKQWESLCKVTDTGWFANENEAHTENEGDAHLHQLSLTELHVEIEHNRKEKKNMRKILRDFEENFLIQNGRKLQKEDRYPLQTEYSEYKEIKARLRLLEALVLKHHE